MMKFIGVIAFVCVIGAVAAEVAVLTPDNFDSVIDGSTHALVEFYAPWCGHCKKLEPEYTKLGDMFTTRDGVVIAKVDADAHRDLAGKFDVRGFPTLKWFPQGTTTPEDYNGGREIPDFVEFINSKTGLNKRVKTDPTDVVALSSRTFDSIALDPAKSVLVEFYAPWCGHCKQLAPTYEQVASTYVAEDNVVVAKVDATKYRDLAERFDVTGYPTIKFFGAGDDKEPQTYNEARSAEAFVEFLNSKSGAHRVVGGGLDDTAGRVAELDALAQKFAANPSQAVLDEAKEAAAASGADTARHYLKAMEKALKKPAYLNTELERMLRMIDSPSVKPDKKTNFMIRRNVLRAFQSADENDDEL